MPYLLPEPPADSASSFGLNPNTTPFSGRRKRSGELVLLTVLVAVMAVASFVALRRKDVAPPKYLLGLVSRGPLMESVRATGTVQPLSQVQVGAQVTGRIVRVCVDFNSKVKVGDLLGEIDPVPYRAQVAHESAALLAARAQQAQGRANAALAEANVTRQHRLRDQGVNSPAELDAAVASQAESAAAVEAASAAVAQAEAALAIARANLSYTRILAPINGTIASRAVESGQTVAVALQAPTLFLIAHDLSSMQAIANVDETNVGRLSEGMEATVRVDAFPQVGFEGNVSQLRIMPTTTNGVVTYQAVINVRNPKEALRPGMTATITVITSRRDAALLVPNAALRYRPELSLPTEQPKEPLAESSARQASETVYVVNDGEGKSEAIPVTIGITDGTRTEIVGGSLNAGQRVILDETGIGIRTPAPNGPPGPRLF